mgnify:CR=1 FL=1
MQAINSGGRKNEAWFYQGGSGNAESYRCRLQGKRRGNPEAIHEMEKEHVKLMVFPEFCITGYTCHDLFSPEMSSGQCVG